MSDEWCRSICIIAEGDEEKYYLERLLSFRVFNHPCIKIDSIRNARGINNVFPLFQNVYSSGRFDIIVVFCDGDNNSNQFKKLLSKIDHELFGDKEISSKIVFFANPVTLQIVLSHFDEVQLHNKGKSFNAPEVERLTGIIGYKAKEEQIVSMTSSIKYQSYQDMKNRISKLSNNVNDIPSTNFLRLLEMLEGNAMNDLDEVTRLLNK